MSGINHIFRQTCNIVSLFFCDIVSFYFLFFDRYRAQKKKEKFMKRYEAEPSVFNNGAYEKSEWRPAYGDPTGASTYSYQSPGGNVAFYDTRMALDDYFE